MKQYLYATSLSKLDIYISIHTIYTIKAWKFTWAYNSKSFHLIIISGMVWALTIRCAILTYCTTNASLHTGVTKHQLDYCFYPLCKLHEGRCWGGNNEPYIPHSFDRMLCQNLKYWLLHGITVDGYTVDGEKYIDHLEVGGEPCKRCTGTVYTDSPLNQNTSYAGINIQLDDRGVEVFVEIHLAIESR